MPENVPTHPLKELEILLSAGVYHADGVEHDDLPPLAVEAIDALREAHETFGQWYTRVRFPDTGAPPAAIAVAERQIDLCFEHPGMKEELGVLPLVLEFFHGRKTVDEKLEDWGTQGPNLLILGYHSTYNGSTIRLTLPNPDFEFFLDPWRQDVKDGTLVEDLWYYDGVFYGDMIIRSLRPDDRVEWFDPKKAVWPKESGLPTLATAPAKQ